jgi:GTPase involved in cell partitioning and DNA repair
VGISKASAAVEIKASGLLSSVWCLDTDVSGPAEMGPVCSPETWIYYHLTLCNNRELLVLKSYDRKRERESEKQSCSLRAGQKIAKHTSESVQKRSKEKKLCVVSGLVRMTRERAANTDKYKEKKKTGNTHLQLDATGEIKSM